MSCWNWLTINYVRYNLYTVNILHLLHFRLPLLPLHAATCFDSLLPSASERPVDLYQGLKLPKLCLCESKLR